MHRYQRWRDALLVASSQESVIALMRDYAHALPETVRVVLPASCRDAIVGDPLDVQITAVMLLREELTHTAGRDASEMLHEVARTFAAASVRMAMLQGAISPD